MFSWFFVFFLPAHAAEPRAAFVNAVLDAHPNVLASERSIDAARNKAAATAPLAPVMLRVDTAPLSLMAMPGVEVEAGWELPVGGMRRLERAASADGVGMAEATAAMTRVELAARASLAWDDAWEITHLAAILDQHAVALREAAGAVGRRIGAGLLPPEARVMAEMARVDLDEERLTLARRARETVAALDALSPGATPLLRDDLLAVATRMVAEPATAPPALSDTPDPVLPADLVPPPVTPAVAMAESERAMNEGMARAEARAGFPMIETMAGYSTMWEDPMHRLMVGVSVAVPIDRAALRARADAARAEAEAAAARADVARRDSATAIANARAMVEESRAMEALMAERMAPLAEERVRLARTAWESGRGTLADWLAAQQEAVHTNQRRVTAAAETRRAEAMLAMALGQVIGETSPQETPR